MRSIECKTAQRTVPFFPTHFDDTSRHHCEHSKRVHVCMRVSLCGKLNVCACVNAILRA